MAAFLFLGLLDKQIVALCGRARSISDRVVSSELDGTATILSRRLNH